MTADRDAPGRCWTCGQRLTKPPPHPAVKAALLGWLALAAWSIWALDWRPVALGAVALLFVAALVPSPDDPTAGEPR